MKKLCEVAVLVLLVCTLPAFALSDSEYSRMMRNADFAKADQELNSTWKRVSKVLSGSALETLKSDQREWIRTGRDDEASNFMDKGFSRVEAYTAATYKMVHQLLKAEFLYVPRSGGQEVYKHDNVDVWLKVIPANRKGTEIEVKLFALWEDGDGGEAMGTWSGRGRLRDETGTIADKDYEDCSIEVLITPNDEVSVETTSDFARFCIGIDEAIDGTFYKVSE